MTLINSAGQLTNTCFTDRAIYKTTEKYGTKTCLERLPESSSLWSLRLPVCEVLWRLLLSDLGSSRLDVLRPSDNIISQTITAYRTHTTQNKLQPIYYNVYLNHSKQIYIVP